MRTTLICCGLSALMMCIAAARADQPTTRLVDQSTWPQKVTITIGDIRTRIDGPKMWTLSGIDFQNHMMATEDSAYGTVLTIRNVGHLGTAHFLDIPGKPGEVEKELVSSLKFFIDEKPVAKFTPEMTLSGKSFRMERTSKIRQLDLTSTVTIQNNVLIETAHFHLTGPMDLQKAHPTMYAFTPEATRYVFGNEKGIQKRGEFIKEGKGEATAVNDLAWFALFNPKDGMGSVCYLLKHPSKPGYLMVDAPGVYRKLAQYTLVDEIVPEGFDATYQTAVGFFTATESDWEQKAVQRANELRNLNPKN